MTWSPGFPAAKGEGTPNMRSPAKLGWKRSSAIASSATAGRGAAAMIAAAARALHNHFDDVKDRISAQVPPLAERLQEPSSREDANPAEPATSPLPRPALARSGPSLRFASSAFIGLHS